MVASITSLCAISGFDNPPSTSRKISRSRRRRLIAGVVPSADGAALDGDGILADVAPTVLDLLGVEKPAEMTGESLVARG